jgi:hypothetical protein
VDIYLRKLLQKSEGDPNSSKERQG